jgi:thiol-disulfide isomerase/thioredoxin
MKKLALICTVALTALALTSTALARSKPEKPERIAFGQEVDIKQYLVPGKTVVFDFTSDFCPPCRAINPYLDKLHANRADVVVVKVDINRPDVRGIDWQSPVAKQYNMRSIPYFQVYGPDGEMIAEGQQARQMVTASFEE